MTYLTRQYGSPQRYLLKALREVAHQVEDLLVRFDERELRWRPADDEWCAIEIAGFLRDSEREDLRAVRAMVARDGARIEERRAHHGPAEQDYRRASAQELAWEFAFLREDLVATLQMAEGSWEHGGRHPFRGRVTLAQWVHEISDRDLEATWKLRRLRDQLDASGGP